MAIKKLTTALGLLLLLAAPAVFAQTAAVRKIPLHAGWRFRQAGKAEWRPATVPGCVHTDLLDNRLIEDPFYRDNEPKLQWIGKTDWEYELSFTVGPDVLARRRLELNFEGLDTYANVTLNGRPLLDADNMFRTWRVDVKNFLKPGANTLHIRFRSPVNEVLPVMARLGYELPAVNDQGEKTSPHTRKAPYHYGWDWGPRFVTSGIWQPVTLEAWDDARLSDLRVTQNQLAKESAQLTADVEVVSAGNSDAVIVVEDAATEKITTSQPVKLSEGTNRFALKLAIPNPSLWWPNGLGPQTLYTLRARLVIRNRPADELSTRIGLRTLELRQQPDKAGKSFMFVVNGVPVFAKGGNWIPADSFPTRITRERYRHLLQSARDAHMNMLRVWGGGIYERDEFYELCDELGLMVWQDFMFACSMYPGDRQFLDSVRAEATDQVRRLRNHPSIVLWCGNNEVETAWMHWGWKERLPAKLWDDYKKLFHGVLPEVVAQQDPSRPYWPSSPSSNLEDDADSQRMGDVHYWQVWHASRPFDEYEKQFPRFMSEYGFQSFPLIESVRAYTRPSDHDIESPVMLAHQKHPRGNQLVREYMLREYPQPKDFESFLYVSQILQAEGIRVGTEHMRRIMPHNMGALYWQVNDCWPVASWSGIDYFGRWKAMHFYARRFFNDLLLSPHEEDGRIKFYVVSDRTTRARAELRVRLLDFDGRVLKETRTEIEVDPLTSKPYQSMARAELLRGHDTARVFLHAELLVGGGAYSKNSVFFKPFKELALAPAKVTATTAGGAGRGDVIVTLKTDRLARGVHLSAEGLEGTFSENFFDMMPGETALVLFRAPRRVSAAELSGRLRVRSLADAFAAR
ncbi:MAG TPA: glycoside hydrolase family 2 protein [Pyrinomonadaceae bacterium]|nr:glycoside hydrolase family 2 protein [Pyrinomonadaceae bacterium]